MKCPKCGFTSFDFLENCKKCGQDLQGHKQKFGLRSLIFPTFTAAETTAKVSGKSEEATAVAAAAASDSDFGFDFMSDDPAAGDESSFETTPSEAVPESATEGDQDFDAFEFEDETAMAATDLVAEEEAVATDDAEEDQAGIDLADDFDFADDDEVEAAPEAGEEALEDSDEFAFASAEDSLVIEDEADGIDFGDPADDLDFSESTSAESDAEDWAAPEEEAAVDEKEKVSEETREPSDPFDLRGPAETERVPGLNLPTEPLLFADEATEADAAFTEELPPPQATTFPPLAPGELEDDETTLGGQSEAAFGFSGDGADPDLNGEVTGEGPDHADGDSSDAVLLAPLGSRLVAGLCDLLILALVFVLFLMVGQKILFNSPAAGILPNARTLVDLSGPYFLVLFALSFGYFTLFHFLTGQTPGKMLFRLRVEDLAGQPLRFSQAFLRSVGGLFSLLPAGLGFLVIFFSRTQRGWNDLLAGSRLVPVFDQPADPEEAQEV